VPGLRTIAADEVLKDLEEAGYSAWPLVVGADDVGAPHRRKRVWIVARKRLADGDGERERYADELRRSSGEGWSGTTDVGGGGLELAHRDGIGRDGHGRDPSPEPGGDEPEDGAPREDGSLADAAGLGRDEGEPQIRPDRQNGITALVMEEERIAGPPAPESRSTSDGGVTRGEADTTACSAEEVRLLWQRYSEAHVSQRSLRLPVDVYRETLLQSGLSGAWAAVEDSIAKFAASTGAAVSWVEVRDVRDDDGSARPPQGQEQHQQRAGEPDDAVPVVPHPMALGAWPSRPGQKQLVWEPSRLVYPTNRQAQPGLGRSFDGLPHRLESRIRRERLKALGNSVVPQIPEILGRAILAARAKGLG